MKTCIAQSKTEWKELAGSVRGLGAFELVLFIRSQLKPQAITNLLRDRVLHINDVGGISIDAITPEQISRVDVHQLRGHADAIARAQKTCGQDCGHAHLAAGLSRINLHALVLNNL